MKIRIWAADEMHEVTEAQLYDDSLHVECETVSPDGRHYTETGYGPTLVDALIDLKRRLEGGA